MSPREQIRWAGVVGLVGALLLAFGDQLLYVSAASGPDYLRDLRAIVAAAPTARVLTGAGLAPLATLLYLAGFWHVYRHVRERQPRLGALVGIGLVLCMLAGASYHALWGAKALSIKAAIGADAAMQPAFLALETAIRDYAANVYLIAEIAGYPTAVLLAVLIVLGRTDYPRWMVVLTPAVPVLLLQFLAPYAPAPFGSLLNGSAVNLSFALFFAVSLALTRDGSVQRNGRA